MEDRNQEWQELTSEVKRLQEQVNQGQKTIKNLEMKLKNARHMLDVEKERRITAENEKGDLVRGVEDLGSVIRT